MRSPRLNIASIAFVALVVLASGCEQTRNVAEQANFEPSTPGVLTVATTLPAPGFWEGYYTSTLTGGYEWAIAEALAQRFDLRLQVVDVPFKDIVAGRLGPADLALSQISITDEREKSVDFSVPYYTTGSGVLGKESEEMTDLKTARERTWAVLDGTTHAKFIDDVIKPDEPPLLLHDNEAVAEAVADGTVDAGLFDLATSLVLQHKVPGVTTIAQFATDERYGAALPKGSPNGPVLDAALRALDADGSLRDFEKEWLAPTFGVKLRDIPLIQAKI